MNTNREEEWEKKFDNRFKDSDFASKFPVKSFIKILLQSERKRMGESVEQMELPEYTHEGAGHTINGFLHCKERVLAIINNSR